MASLTIRKLDDAGKRPICGCGRPVNGPLSVEEGSPGHPSATWSRGRSEFPGLAILPDLVCETRPPPLRGRGPCDRPGPASP